MTVKSVGSIIDASFIRSFQGLAGSGGPAIGANAGKSATISTGLRFGARTFATAIQNLNATIGVVNIADSTLKQLEKITDKMIDVVERGTSLTAGVETRRVLQADFETLVGKFRKVVDGSELDGVDFLTQEGLIGLFERIGLSREESEGVAAVFRRFVETNEDDGLVSEETKGARPPQVPTIKRSKTAQISNSDIISGGQISPEYSVYTEFGSFGAAQPHFVDSTGTTTAQPGVSLNDQSVLAVNETQGNSVGETSGYTLIVSLDNFTGDNPSNYSQAFLIAPDGTVVRQVTNNASATANVIAGDISKDNLTAAIVIDSGGSQTVSVISVAAIDDDPSLATTVESFAADASRIKISNDAQYLAYEGSGGLTDFKAVGGATDTYLNAAFPDLQDFGFVDSDTIIFRDQAGTSIYSYNFSSSTTTLLVNDDSLTALTALENDSLYSVNDGSPSGTPKVAAFAYSTTTDAGTNRITVVSYDLNAGTLKTRYRTDVGAGTVNAIGLAYQQDLNTGKDRLDLGVAGALPAINGDSNREMYRVSETKFATNNSLFAPASSDPTNVLDGNVLTRADSYRLLGDLKALKQQMSDNIDALDNARNYIASNVSLVRAAGFAFLNLSDQLKGTEDAAEVAQLVATEIRKTATTAELAQVENLRNIASVTVDLLSS